MNLQAVLLFVCISTAYGLQCKQGIQASGTSSNGEHRSENKVEMVECSDDSIMCARVTMSASNEQGSASGTVYLCGGRDCTEVGCRSGTKHGYSGEICCSSTALGALLAVIIAFITHI